jgi:hypothetical protein
MWKQAVRSSSQLLPASFATPAVDGLKVWPLWGAPEGELRVVVINKRPADAMNVTLRVPRGGSWGDAAVTRLVARGEAPLEAKGAAITLGGITYGIGGILQGSAYEEAAPRIDDEGRPAWKVYMPAGSAALLVIRRGAAADGSGGGGAVVK